LLCHALLFTKLGDVLPDALSFLFVLYHIVASEYCLSLNNSASPDSCL
jgi:hypothetical protein